MGLKIGMVGVGAFAQNFIPLFKAHPMVDEVILCDIDAKKLADNCALHGIEKTSPSLDRLCDTDVDAVVIITQNWLHGPQALQALKAGKHVYSAVPLGMTIEEVSAVVKMVEQTGKIYMMGETSYYYPAAIYCRDKYRKGEFGHVVYGEAEYYHDWDHGLYEVHKWRGGEKWLETAGKPPMMYCTHSASMIVSVTGAHMTHVSCQGFVDKADDGIYKADVNLWHNTFSDQTALFKMSDGSCCRINEFRRIGSPGACRMSLFGTQGCFELNSAGAMWLTKDKTNQTRLDDILECKDQPARKQNSEKMDAVTADDGTHLGVSAVHPVEQLPKAFMGLPNGHKGSHQFLVNDFVTACMSGKTPPNNVWQSARYTVPGLIAHESSMQGGKLMEVPDFGNPKF